MLRLPDLGRRYRSKSGMGMYKLKNKYCPPSKHLIEFLELPSVL